MAENAGSHDVLRSLPGLELPTRATTTHLSTDRARETRRDEIGGGDNLYDIHGTLQCSTQRLNRSLQYLQQIWLIWRTQKAILNNFLFDNHFIVAHISN